MNWIQNMNRCVGPASWDASKGAMMIFEEWMKARPMNGLYLGDLKAAWDFATLEEREACAKVCYEIGGGDTGWTRTVGEVCADAIRMRGTHEND